MKQSYLFERSVLYTFLILFLSLFFAKSMTSDGRFREKKIKMYTELHIFCTMYKLYIEYKFHYSAAAHNH